MEPRPVTEGALPLVLLAVASEAEAALAWGSFCPRPLPQEGGNSQFLSDLLSQSMQQPEIPLCGHFPPKECIPQAPGSIHPFPLGCPAP